MKRILIIGCGGSGKSTLARQLGEKLNIEVVHLDRLFWKPGWVESSREEIDDAIVNAMQKENWILDGNYSRTLPMRLKQCDTVIYLDFNRVACILGVLKRVLVSYGKVRPDMADGCPERFDWEFLRWVWNYNQKHRAKTYGLLEEADHARIIVLKNRAMVRRFLRSL